MMIVNDSMFFKVTNMSDKSELKAELERKKQRLAQIREEKKRKEEERKKKEVCFLFLINNVKYLDLISSRLLGNTVRIVKNLAVVTVSRALYVNFTLRKSDI